MSLEVSVLSRFAVGAKAKATWVPPTAEDFSQISVLSFDQSFSATGWTMLSHDEDGLRVEAAQTLRAPTPEGLKGAERDLWRADWLRDQVAGLLDDMPDVGVVAYEMPPTGPGVRNPEVSLLCASAIRNAAHGAGFPPSEVVSIHSSTGKKIACGKANSDKATAHAAMPDSLGWIGGYHLISNEAKRDALLVGLAAMKRGTK